MRRYWRAAITYIVAVEQATITAWFRYTKLLASSRHCNVRARIRAA